MAKYILGLNSVYHEPSACLLKDGKIIAAAEEERFNRIKHSAFGNAFERLPFNAIDFCLNEENINMEEIDFISYSFDPYAKRLLAYTDNFLKIKLLNHFSIKDVLKVPNKLEDVYNCNISNKFIWIKHHLCHAASTFFVSPFKKSAILSIDGIGEYDTTILAYGIENKIYTINTIEYPNSIGFLWEFFSKFLGFSRRDSCKIMGMAAYGDSKKYTNQFKKIIKINEGNFSVDLEKIIGLNIYPLCLIDPFKFIYLKKIFNKKIISKDNFKKIDYDIAASLQESTENIVINLCNYLYEKTGFENLCISGGVGLNCAMNKILLDETDFKDIYIQPAAYDAGTAIGAAFYVWNQLNNNNRNFVMRHSFLGPKYSERYIQKTLEESNVKYIYKENIEQASAEIIASGKYLGWFQERLEFGPRALGHRSILVDPRDEKIKETMNTKIKKREWFRPYAAAVLKDKAGEYFDLYKPTISHEFMLFAVKAKENKCKEIPAVIHKDQTSRIQLVDKEVNPKFYNLIKEFENITGVPLVLNTSFNRRGEPIVCSPKNAIDMLNNTALDYLVIENFLIG